MLGRVCASDWSVLERKADIDTYINILIIINIDIITNVLIIIFLQIFDKYVHLTI